MKLVCKTIIFGRVIIKMCFIGFGTVYRTDKNCYAVRMNTRSQSDWSRLPRQLVLLQVELEKVRAPLRQPLAKLPVDAVVVQR